MVESVPSIPDPKDSDLALVKRSSTEFWKRIYPKIRLYILDKDESTINDLYAESSEPVFKDPVETWAYIDHSPSKWKLNKFGLDGERDLMVYFNTAILEEQDLLQNNTTFLIGSLISFDDDFYVILSQHRDKSGYWANTNVPIHIVCSCSRYIHGK